MGYGDKQQKGVVRGVAYRPRQRVLLAARLECRLAAGSRPRNGDEHRSLVLWAVGQPTSHWGLCLVVVFLSSTVNTRLPSHTCTVLHSKKIWQVMLQQQAAGRVANKSIRHLFWQKVSKNVDRFCLGLWCWSSSKQNFQQRNLSTSTTADRFYTFTFSLFLLAYQCLQLSRCLSDLTICDNFWCKAIHNASIICQYK